ncbi:unnamed protein product [Effrenium voratum]|uniref:Fibronectin type-III domain-containing protein n=1 Tax=Effrenium voratum TaxID=2562239 RepID=A0AA36MQ27_9DINO|nr:unnamed protein product [Effrenium voratum]
MGDGVSRQPPKSQEKPPAWHAIEESASHVGRGARGVGAAPRRPRSAARLVRVLEVLCLSAPTLGGEPDHIPLPRDPPLQTVEGHYLVSQAQRAQKPNAQVGLGEGARPNQNPVATFEESMFLRMEKLDHHLVAYVWATKTSLMGAQTTTLVGRALAPLQEFQLQRRTTTWGIFDILEGHRVAEMRLRYHACTTPAPVEDIAMADVKQTEVTVQWSPPRNDHGAPVVGYKISILLDPKPSEPPEWYTLCECTKSLNPVYVVANLKGNTAYLLDIRALNKVGLGDPNEFQITTAPVAPDAPGKPWVEESRDGCLNVAWLSPENDGGMPITAFRIRMRKILGASRWNVFGPGQSAASWVEMGSVKAGGGLNFDPQYLVNMKDDTRWLCESPLAEFLRFSEKSDPFFVVPSSREPARTGNAMTQTLQAKLKGPVMLPLQSALLRRIRKAELVIMKESMQAGWLLMGVPLLQRVQCLRNLVSFVGHTCVTPVSPSRSQASEWPSDQMGPRSAERVRAGKRAGKFIACTVCEHVLLSQFASPLAVEGIRKVLASEELSEALGDAKGLCAMKRLAQLFRRARLEVAIAPDGTAEMRTAKGEPFYEEINKSELAFHWKSFAVEHACVEIFRSDGDLVHGRTPRCEFTCEGLGWPWSTWALP